MYRLDYGGVNAKTIVVESSCPSTHKVVERKWKWDNNVSIWILTMAKRMEQERVVENPHIDWGTVDFDKNIKKAKKIKRDDVQEFFTTWKLEHLNSKMCEVSIVN